MTRPLFVPPTDAPDHLGIGRTKLYELMNANMLPTVLIDGRRMIDLERAVEMVRAGALAGRIGGEAPAAPEPPAKRPRGRPRKVAVSG